MLHFFIQILFLCWLPLTVNGFYFYSNGGERKCFYKELSKDALLKASYSVQIYDFSSGSYINPSANDLVVTIDVLDVFDDNHRVAHHQSMPAAGDYKFKAIESGEHKLCFQTNLKGWLAKSKIKVNIEFQVGTGPEIDLDKKDTMQLLEQRVSDLIDKVAGIRNEQTLVREREAQFRDTSERANSSVMWWSIITLIVLAVICFWQLNHLRTFFVKQKVL